MLKGANLNQRLYEPLNGTETKELISKLVDELKGAIDNHSGLGQHVTWPRAELELRLRVSSIDNQTPVEIRVQRGPILAPDEIRETLSLPVPVMIAAPEGKRETRVGARAAKSRLKGSNDE